MARRRFIDFRAAPKGAGSEVAQALQGLREAMGEAFGTGLVFPAEVQNAGPDGEADYVDRRHWVKEQIVTIDTGDPEDIVFAARTGGRWVRAFNLTGQHYAVGTLVLVSANDFPDGTFYFIERELAGEPGTGLTDDVTVVTGFDEDTCVATTAVLEFVNGLLISVT